MDANFNALQMHAKHERRRQRIWGVGMLLGVCPAIVGVSILIIAAKDDGSNAGALPLGDRIALGAATLAAGVAVFAWSVWMNRRLDKRAAS